MTTTTSRSPIQGHLLHGRPLQVMADVAILQAHGALRSASDPAPHPSRPGEIVVKVLVDSRVAVPRSTASTEVALRQAPVPARAVPLRHPAAKPGWSVKRKLAVAGGSVLGISLLLGWLTSQLITIDLRQMAATVLGYGVFIVLVVAGVLKALSGGTSSGGGGGDGCSGIHCGGCASH